MFFERFYNALMARCVLFTAPILLVTGMAHPAWGQTATAGQLLISEFRLCGPGDMNCGPTAAVNEFIEIYNNSGADHTVTAASGTGYGVAASDGTTRCSIPNGTVIPFRGHYLCVNSTGYTLASYPAGNGTTATGDATFTTDIPNNAGIALFNNNTGGGSYSLANRLDAVGSTSEANTLYKEGTGYPALTPFSIDYSFVRDTCGKGGAVNLLGPCTITTPKDTDNNAVDFIFVDTNGTSAGAGQRLGAPGPENLSSPFQGNTTIPNARLDTSVANFSPPNFVRDFTSDPANNSTFGTLSIRRRYTNNTGGSVTRLRFRIADQSTFPAASGFADLRARTSSAVVVAGVNDATTCAATGAPATPPCTVTVQGTTLEQPPSQPNGSAFNGSMSVGTVTLATPLANGASINLQFLFGIQQTGDFRVDLHLEAIPGGGGDELFLQCHTDGICPPTVSSIVRADPNPTSAASVNYTVTFDRSVTAVDLTDFSLVTTGVSGASVTNVSGSGATYTVTVDTGTGTGTIRLDVLDDDTILGAPSPLGGMGAGNGDFTTGEVYTIISGAVCGNGSTETGEDCDDSNTANGDCCDSACQFEGSGSSCDDGNSCTVTDTCDGAGVCTGAGSTCGNGTIEGSCGEDCDDGNTANGDCCDSTCQFEGSGSSCDDGDACTVTDACDGAGLCTGAGSTCGNGTTEASCGEQCDDGASNSDTTPDACRTNCTNPSCGDGTQDTGEECDDGNVLNGDGCSDVCLNVPVSQIEICDNNIEDDGDGLADCADHDCATSAACSDFSYSGGGCSLRSEGSGAEAAQAVLALLFLAGVFRWRRRNSVSA